MDCNTAPNVSLLSEFQLQGEDMKAPSYRIPTWFAALIVMCSVPTTLFAEEGQPENKDTDSRIQSLIDQASYHEIYGRNDLRDALLEKAAKLSTEKHASIQSMKGRVNIGVGWKTPAQIAEICRASQKHMQYVEARDKAEDSFEGQVQLARICQQSGMTAQCNAHLQRALWHNPNSVEVRNQLGHRRIEGRWVTPAQMQAEAHRLYIARRRFDAWAPQIRELHQKFSNKAAKQKAEALESLRKIDDVSSINAIELILANHSPEVSVEVVRKLAQFKETESSLALVRIAMNSRWDATRQMATKALSTRDKYDYVPTLISELVSPIISRVTVIPGARGQVLYRHIYLQKTIDKDIVRQYDTVYQRISSGLTNGNDSLRQTMRDIRRNIPQNEGAKAAQNISAAANNKRITSLLQNAVGVKLGDDVAAWWKWWNDYNEVFTSQRPVDYERYQRQLEVYDRDLSMIRLNRPTGRVATGGGCECLVAGTLILTERGLLPVESIKVGDQVLSQNIETGHLEYKMVLRPTVRPATATFKIRLNGETIQASGGHPFWVAGKGWVKARDLKTGMALHCVRGSKLISAIEAGDKQKLYNMVVEENANYFVGKSQILSHDNTIQKPTRRLLPGMSN